MISALAKIVAAYVASGILKFFGVAIGGPVGLAMYAAGEGVAASSGLGNESFAVGSPNIPNDMLANVHKGEMIIPATFAQGIRSGKLSVGQSGETNSLLNTVVNKLDMIGQFAQEKGQIILGDSQLKVLSSAIYKSQYRSMEMGTA